VYMMTQKGVPYTKLFSILSEIGVLFCVLLQSNSLCSGLVKPYYTKIRIHLLFTVHMLRPFYTFSNILDFTEAKWSIH